jgi:hypothetical protein
MWACVHNQDAWSSATVVAPHAGGPERATQRSGLMRRPQDVDFPPRGSTRVKPASHRRRFPPLAPVSRVAMIDCVDLCREIRPKTRSTLVCANSLCMANARRIDSARSAQDGTRLPTARTRIPVVSPPPTTAGHWLLVKPSPPTAPASAEPSRRPGPARNPARNGHRACLRRNPTRGASQVGIRARKSICRAVRPGARGRDRATRRH